MREIATHEHVAEGLRVLAEQFESGRIDMSSEESAPVTEVADPVEVTFDLIRSPRRAELAIRLRWRPERRPSAPVPPAA